MDLSIIIVSYNVKFFLNLCLCSVRKAADGINCEIFVVDNNSSDGSCNMIRTEYPEVKLLENDKNRGFSTAVNQALKLASGNYILLLNPDTVIGEDTFSKCIRFMEKHPDAGAAGVMMINGRGKFLPESRRAFPFPATAFYKISGLSYIFPGSPIFNQYYMGNIDPNVTSYIDVLPGAFMFLRKEAVIKTGTLDESFFMYGEDIDYSYRLLRAGFKNYYYPDVKIIHFKGESTKKEEIGFVINFYNAMLIFVKKHFNNGKLKIFVLPIRLAILFRAGISLTGRFLRHLLMPLYKLSSLLNPTGRKSLKKTRFFVASDEKGYKRINDLLSLTDSQAIAERISIENDDEQTVENLTLNIRNIIDTAGRKGIVREVIFNSGQIRFSSIIDCIQNLSGEKVSFRIASPGEKYLLTGGSVTASDIQITEFE